VALAVPPDRPLGLTGAAVAHPQLERDDPTRRRRVIQLDRSDHERIPHLRRERPLRALLDQPGQRRVLLESPLDDALLAFVELDADRCRPPPPPPPPPRGGRAGFLP